MEWQVEEKGDTDKMPQQKLFYFGKASFFSLLTNSYVILPCIGVIINRCVFFYHLYIFLADVEEAVPFTDHVFTEKKKLRWDSSDSEEETESKEEQESEKKQETTEEPPTKIPTVKSFFFTRDDDRMKGVANQFCRGKDADVTKVWNNAREEILRSDEPSDGSITAVFCFAYIYKVEKHGLHGSF
ncbi:hypothetical protein BSL78_17956 [Apostichopus japonicus]|uniref:Uncharacterized protein n=1 Tax=Stichopus japonicus TaxID=307972 RepID=A0A2G8KB22_STIJA|nr:hypothetical protein BSL78_17956 [Apostichopus japonicus]